ncbi:stage VI sporulation protein D [Bacillus sp. REN16]|uniref:stage VI sporulation protein D n=1 Tax=Bacillus sp. REN16 TaxID=2887296 RepID=UPI001E483E6E|nr:stage VI sporulation protein D [Bacillus sp. REN16]MCC3356538.1 stage VI sporulation protein D [Bacillus sp. REN16]
MSSENLRFSVEESVWFQKGQEVSELISISLDPDIVIQEHDQYVSIRGALQLTGEYRIDEINEEEGERDFASVRLVNEVITREDGISELNHRFPVDITIPQDRVQSLDDVYVLIETFDYEIPKRGCLQIVADLAISGIHGITQTPKEESVPEAVKQEEQTPIVNEQPAEEELELVRSSSFEKKETQDAVAEEQREEVIQVSAEERDEVEEVQVVAEEKREEPEESPVVAEEKREEPEKSPVVAKEKQEEPEENQVVAEETREDEEVVLQNKEEVVLHNEEQEVIAVSEQQDEEEDSDLFVPFEVEARKEVYLEQEEVEVIEAIEEEEEVHVVLTPSIEVKARHDNQLTFGSDQPKKKSTTAIQEKEAVQDQRHEQNEEEQIKRNENDLLLTKIFGRDEVDDHSTMKICIVQHGDSLEKISQRYEISVQQLVRVNSLNTDSVSEGQLLYIPVQAHT